MRKTLLPLLATLSIILILGCLTNSPSGQVEISSEGVKIVAYSVDKNPVQSEERIGILFRVQNVGEQPAKDAKLCIKRKGDFSFAPSTSNALCTEEITGHDLGAPDARVAMAGQYYEQYWQIDAPKVDFPLKQPIVSQLSYQYSTEATREVPIMTKGRMDELRESTAELHPGTSTLTLAPIQVEIHAQDPVQVDLSGAKTFPFDIVLTNIGKGYVKGDYQDADRPGWCTDNLNCIDSLELGVTELLGGSMSCENSTGEDVTTGPLLIDNQVYSSQGGSTDSGTIHTYDLNTYDATKLEISYDYIYYAATNGHEAHILTYLDGKQIDDFSFKSPFNGIGGGIANSQSNTLWSTSPRKLTVDIDRDTNHEIRFDYSNGDYRVKIKNINILEIGGTPRLQVFGISLWQGKEARVNCKMSVDLGDESERYPIIRARASYHYYLEDTLEMEVLP